jgi:hypothetical protein
MLAFSALCHRLLQLGSGLSFNQWCLLFCVILLVTLLLAYLQVHKGDVLHGLQSNAVEFEPGKEPWRRLAAAAAGTSSSNVISTDAAEAAAVAAAAALGNRMLYVADQLFADNDATLANAIKTTNNEYWREYRLVSTMSPAAC